MRGLVKKTRVVRKKKTVMYESILRRGLTESAIEVIINGCDVVKTSLSLCKKHYSENAECCDLWSSRNWMENENTLGSNVEGSLLGNGEIMRNPKKRAFHPISNIDV